MKRILTLFISLFIWQFSFAQTWQYSSKGNAFDGKYKMAYVDGLGGEFPYNDPYLALTKYENKKDIDIYISDAGSYDSDQGVAVYLIFDNEPDVKYKAIGVSYSTDNSAIFFDYINYPPYASFYNNLDKIKIIEKLKKASKLYVRIEDDYYGQKDLTFSLRGSTKALNFLTDYEKNKSIIKNSTKENYVQKLIYQIEDKLSNLENNSNDWRIKLSKQISKDFDDKFVFDSIKVVPHSRLYKDFNIVEVFYVDEENNSIKIDVALKAVMN